MQNDDASNFCFQYIDVYGFEKNEINHFISCMGVESDTIKNFPPLCRACVNNSKLWEEKSLMTKEMSAWIEGAYKKT